MLTPGLNIGIGEYSLKLMSGLGKHLLKYDSRAEFLTLNSNVFINDKKIVFEGDKENLKYEIDLSQEGLGEENLSNAISSTYFELNNLQQNIARRRDISSTTSINIIVPLFDNSAKKLLRLVVESFSSETEIGSFGDIKMNLICISPKLSHGLINKNIDLKKISRGTLEMIEELCNLSNSLIQSAFIIDDVNKNRQKIGLSPEQACTVISELISVIIFHSEIIDLPDLIRNIYKGFGISIVNLNSDLLKTFVKASLYQVVFKREGLDSDATIDTDYVVNETNAFLRNKLNIIADFKKQQDILGNSFYNYVKQNEQDSLNEELFQNLSQQFHLNITEHLIAGLDKKVKNNVSSIHSDLSGFLDKHNDHLLKERAILGNLLGENDEKLSGDIHLIDRYTIEDIECQPIDYFLKFIPSDQRVTRSELKGLKKRITVSNNRIKELESELKEIDDTLSTIDSLKGVTYKKGVFSVRGRKINANGYMPSSERPDDIKFTPPDNKNLPQLIDLREYFSPTLNQSFLPSCTAFAVASSLEYLAIKNNQQHIDISKLFLYFEGRALQNEVNELSGTSIYSSFDQLKKTGACFESTWPYDVAKANDKPNNDAYEEARQYKLDEAKRVLIKEDHIKWAIAEGYPVIVGLRIYKSFYLAKNNGLVPYPSDQELGDDNRGNHAVLLVGYSESEKYFLARNSWGTDFGEKGYCFIPYDYIANAELCHDAFIITKMVDLSYEPIVEEPIWTNFFSAQSNHIRFNIVRYELVREKKRLDQFKEEYIEKEEQYIDLVKKVKRPEYREELQQDKIVELEEKRQDVFKEIRNNKVYHEIKKKSHQSLGISIIIAAVFVILSISLQFWWLLLGLALIPYLAFKFLSRRNQAKKIPRDQFPKSNHFVYFAQKLGRIEDEIKTLRIDFKIASLFLVNIGKLRNEFQQIYNVLFKYLNELNIWSAENNQQLAEISFDSPVFVKRILNKGVLVDYFESKKNDYLSEWPGFFHFVKDKLHELGDLPSESNERDFCQDIRQTLENYMEGLIVIFDDFDIQAYLLGEESFPYMAPPPDIQDLYDEMSELACPFIHFNSAGATNEPNVFLIRGKSSEYREQFDKKLTDLVPGGMVRLIHSDSKHRISLVRLEHDIPLEDIIIFKANR